MYDILGIGYAMTDKKIRFDGNDAVMRRFLPYKGRFASSSDEDFKYLATQKCLDICAGGSVANSIRDLGVLGINAAYMGKIGQDDTGRFFEKSLCESGVEPLLIYDSGHNSGGCLVMVHDDGEKTVCAKAGAAKTMKWEDFDSEVLKTARAFFIEGYVLNHNPGLVLKLSEFAGEEKIKVYLTLADAACVRNNREILCELLPKIDILFGNEAEFAELGDIGLPLLAVMTRGANGSSILINGKWQDYAAPRCEKICNTNGAGDAFAAGFLSAFIKGKSIGEAVITANETAAAVLASAKSYLARG